MHAKDITGFSTIEMLIAFAVLTLGFTGLLTVVFGNNSFAIDASLNNTALWLAEKNLNAARGQLQRDFTGFSGFSGADDEERYKMEVAISGITPCKNLLTSAVSWEPAPQRRQRIVLQTVVASVEELFKLGGDCPDEPSNSDWQYPSTISSQSLSADESILPTSIDYAGGYAYIASNSETPEQSDFWIVDVSNPLSPYLKSTLNTGAGLFSVDVADNWAYAAANATSGQLITINLQDKQRPYRAAATTLIGVPPDGSYPQARAIFYYNGRAYVGTRETAGPEFHIFDVSDPTNPVHLGARELNHTVQSIFVRGNYAFIATSGNQNELIVLDISSPEAITPPFPGVGKPEPWRFDAAGNEDGTAIYVLGTKAYLGRTRTAGGRPNFYILDVQNPASPTQLSAVRLPLSSDAMITDILVSGNLAFLSTTDQSAGLQILDISDPQNPLPRPSCNPTAYNSEKIVGLDFDGSYLYAAGAFESALRIFKNSANNICSE